MFVLKKINIEFFKIKFINNFIHNSIFKMNNKSLLTSGDKNNLSIKN